MLGKRVANPQYMNGLNADTPPYSDSFLFSNILLYVIYWSNTLSYVIKWEVDNISKYWDMNL